MKQKLLLLFLLAGILSFAAKANKTGPRNTQTNTNTQGGILPVNGSVNGNLSGSTPDTYQLTTTGDGLLRITFQTVSPADLYVALYDHDGTTLLNGPLESYNNSTVVFSTDGLAKGIYFVKITPFSTSYGSYTLSDSLFVSPLNDQEPNNSSATALSLPLNGNKTGHVGYLYNSQRDTTDWYKVTTTSDGLLRVSLLTSRSSIYSINALDVNLTVYDNDGATVLGSVEVYNGGNPANASVLVDGLAAGTYYVKVQPYSSSEFADYTISDSLFTSSIANDSEPNNSNATALTLPFNGNKTGHIGYYYNIHRDSTDWYKVTTTSDGLLRVSLSTSRSSIYSTNALDVNLTVYDNDGVTVLGSVEAYNGGNPANASVIVDGLAAGNYYVKVQPYSSNEFAEYTISDSLFTSSITNDSEPNNASATALTLPLNGNKTGHVGYFYNNQRDTTDWYKLTTTADGLLRVSLSTSRSSIYSINALDVNLTVYDNDGVTVLGSVEAYNGGNPANTSVLVDGLAAGNYYVKIQPYSSNEFADYILSDSLLTYNANDVEPDDSAYEARTILSNRTTTGHISFYKNGGTRDASDWFKINYTGTSGNLQFIFKLLPHLSNGAIGDVFFQVYYDTSAAPIFNQEFYGSNDTTNAINLTGLAQGYYYIHIIPYNSNPAYFSAYSLLDSFIQVNKALISINTSKTTLNSSSCGTDSITYNLSGSHSPYTVRLYKNAVLYDSIITTGTTATFKGLSAGNYYATVYGDGATDSAYSKSATSTATPPVPTALTTTAIGVHTATLNFTKLSCTNYYKIQYRAVGSPTWIVVNTTGDTSKLALTGLLPYTLYAWQVASVDTTKGLTFISAFADSVTFRTLSDTAHIALTFKAVGSGCNNDTLTYTSTNSAAPYTVTLYRNGIVYGSPLSVNSVASFYNVPPGNYYAKSTGTGSGGSFGLSGTTQILPPAPTGLSTSNITSVSATLNWDAVSCSNFYAVQYKVTGTNTWITLNNNTDSLMLMNLLPATKYTWHVSALDSANNQTVSSIYSDTVTFTTPGILPVTFVYFNGKLVNNSIQLYWSTATETNNKGYEIEKSIDGNNFSDIAFVQGNGNSSVISNYTYTDLKVAGGNNYYRLKQIDFDGRFTYSSTIKINYSKFDWSILGNPSGNNTWIQLQLDKQTKVSIQVFSINGSMNQIIDKGSLSAGTYSIPLNVNNLSSGIYIVRLITDDQVFTKKFIK